MIEGKPLSVNLYGLGKKFREDIKPPFDLSSVVAQLNEWIEIHRDVLLLAWFAQYGFEPGKAVLVHQASLDGSRVYIREATVEEQADERGKRERAGVA